MNIGLLSQWFEPEPATIPSVLGRQLRSRGHSVRVLTGFPNYPEGRLYEGYRSTWRQDTVVSGMPVRRVALIPNHSASVLGRLANYFSFAATASAFGSGFFRNVDAVWVSNSPPTVGIPTWLIRARYRPRIVLHIMDLWPESLFASGFGSAFRSKWLRFALDRWLSATYETADVIACCTRAQKRLLIARGVPAHKVFYAPLWVDETLFHPAEPDAGLGSHLGTKGKTVLMYVGAIGEPQGLDPVIEVCYRLRGLTNFHCLIAGSGSAERRLRERARALQLTNVSFLGRWPIQDVARLMSIGDVHLVSLKNNGLADAAMPSKVPATLAVAKPLIVAMRGEAADSVSRSGAGWACAPGDVDGLEAAMRNALSVGPAARQVMGAKARALYEAEFSAERGTARIERLLAGQNVDETEPAFVANDPPCVRPAAG